MSSQIFGNLFASRILKDYSPVAFYIIMSTIALASTSLFLILKEPIGVERTT
jgi:hypothetical protein